MAFRVSGGMYLSPASAKRKVSYENKGKREMRKLTSFQGLTVEVVLVEDPAVLVQLTEARIVGEELLGGATSLGVSDDVARLLPPLREDDLITLVGESGDLGSRRGDELLRVVFRESEEREFEAAIDVSSRRIRGREDDGEGSRETRGSVEVEVEFSGKSIDVDVKVKLVQFGNLEEIGVVGSSSSGKRGRGEIDGSDGGASGEGGVEEGVRLSPGGVDRGIGNGVISRGRRRRDVEDEGRSRTRSVEGRFDGVECDCRVRRSECRDEGFDGDSRDDGSNDDGVND